MKVTHLALALAVIPVLALSSGGASGATIGCSNGSCDVVADSYAFHYQENGMLTVSQFGVATQSSVRHVVFPQIMGGPFEPTQNPVEQGRTVTVPGQKATLEVHDSAHAIMVYRAIQAGSITFTLGPEIGAIPLGRTALVGDEEFQADLAVTGEREIEKSVDALMVQLQSDDAVFFRVHGPAGSLGDILASGAVSAELDLRVSGQAVDSDLAAYSPGASIAADSVSSDRASFTFSGLGASSVIIVDFSADLATLLSDRTTFSIGDKSLARFSDLHELVSTSESGFFVATGEAYSEVLIRPALSSGSLLIENIVPGLNPWVAVAALASAVVSVAAGVHLFRRRNQ